MIKIKSNIELFRIVLFLMVISIHVTTMGLVLKSGGMQQNSFPWYYASLMRISVAPAVIGFILISGFLMVNKEFNIKKYFKKLGAPFLIYAPALFLFDYSTILPIHGDIFKKIIFVFGDVISLVGAFYHLWYIVVLVILALFIPYINKLLLYCSRKQHLYLFLLLLFVSTINPTTSLFLDKHLFTGLLGVSSRIFLFIAIYVVGAYFGKYEIKVKKQFFLLGYMIIPISIFVYCIFNSSKTTLNYVELSSLFIVIQGIFLFLFFYRLKFNSEIINYIGGLVYGGYIIHVFFITFLQKFLPYTIFFGSKYYFLIDLSFIFLVAIVALAVEALRVKLYFILTPFILNIADILRFKFKKIVMIDKTTN
ncbi:MAG: acyltransferase family protein [Candidatus Moranbacteria bacterium]|nr:acyltransferase family protein [Candidatus Moranbacteria bacterium]